MICKAVESHRKLARRTVAVPCSNRDAAEMRPLHPLQYVLLVTPNEANRARRGSDRFGDQFGSFGDGGLGGCQAAHDSAVDIRAGSKLAKPVFDGEKFLRDLEH